MHKRMMALLVAVIAATGLLFGAGCSSNASHATEQSSAPAKSELVLAVGGEPDAGFDPTTGWGRYGSPLFQSTLLTRDDKLNIVNDLATEHSVRADGMVWTVKIRTDAKFSDGTPVTAEDVVYTFETAKKSGSVVDLNVMASAKAIDSTTVEFTLTQPQSTFVGQLAALGIVPAKTHGKDYATNPIGSGPYKFVQYDKGQQLIVEPNPEYYGPKPQFKKITFLFMAEDAGLAAAKAGKVDMFSAPASLADQKIKGMHLVTVKSVDNRGIMFPMKPAGGKDKNGNPVGNDVTSDPAIRKAINVALDRSSLVKGVLLGHGSPAYSICDGLAWYNPADKFADADLDGAKKILADGGWKDGDGDGVLEKGGKKATFTLVYPADDQIRQALALASADQAKALGVQINVVGKSWDDIEKLMHANAVLFGWGAHDPLEMYDVYSGSTAGVEYWNPGYYSNPTVDKYMNEALAQTDQNKANELWKQAQWDGTTGFASKDGDVPWTWLVNLDHCYFVADGLDTGKNRVEPHGHGWPITANITEWRWAGK